MKKIGELKTGLKNVDVQGKITDKSPVKTFARMGDPGRVSIAVLEDETGKINLTLWDEQTEEFDVGDNVKVENCSITEFRGVTQIKTGRNGVVQKI